ncbi:helix-turn-helix domain-containing protein [Desulfurococcus amylolyticus]|uniref:helix-turn-helix domain-containing protein n=1 Tax=Desulfurococcus amylolyticus TaxID=94694 RepID=UPI003B8A74AD
MCWKSQSWSQGGLSKYITSRRAREERVLIDHSLYENLLNRGKLSNLEQRVLKLVLEKPGVTVVELARELGVKEKTVRNTLTKLKSKGLVAKKGRNEGVEPTSIAIALYS